MLRSVLQHHRGRAIGGREVLNFSKPGLHRYIGAEAFYFPSIPEDDVMDAYTHSYNLN